MEYNDLVLYHGKKYTIFHDYCNGNYEIRSLNETIAKYVIVHESDLQKV